MAAQLQKFPLLTEGVLNLIKATLQTNFDTYLQQNDLQYKDGISLEKVPENQYYYSDAFQALALPAIYILAGPARRKYVEGPNYYESEDEVVVALTSEDMGADRLTLKSFRYVRVLNGLLNEVDLKTADGRLEIHCLVDEVNYSAPIRDKLNKSEQKYRMDAVLKLKVKHFERNLI